MNTVKLKTWLLPTFVLGLALLLPMLVQSGFQLRLATLICVYAIFAMGFNLLFGMAGQLSLGQQAFYAIGAYAFALLQIHYAVSLPVALLLGVAVSALVALVLALPVLRLRTHYLAMATLMFGMIVHDVALRWSGLTGGSAGLRIPPPELFGLRLDRDGIYYFVLALAVLGFLVQAFVKGTHLGRALEAIKTDETAASSQGIHVTRYKASVFVLAAIFAAVAGISFTIVGRVVDPSFSGISMAISLLTIAVVGGLGSRVGPFMGAAIIILIPQLLASMAEYQTLIYGVGLLLFILFARRGLAGLLDRPKGTRP